MTQLTLLNPALLKDTPPLKFSQFVSDRGARCLIDLGLMSVIQDAAKNKKEEDHKQANTGPAIDATTPADASGN